jgi:hypothetical protein
MNSSGQYFLSGSPYRGRCPLYSLTRRRLRRFWNLALAGCPEPQLGSASFTRVAGRRKRTAMMKLDPMKNLLAGSVLALLAMAAAAEEGGAGACHPGGGD